MRVLIDDEEFEDVEVVFDKHDGYIIIKAGDKELKFDWADIEALGKKAQKKWKE